MPAHDASCDLRFRLLGPFEVWHADHRLSLGGKRPERLLAYLLLEAGHTVVMDRLVEAVWDADPPTTAAHQIRKMVARLRHQFDPHGTLIVTDGPGYRLDVDADQLDLTDFRQHVDDASKTACPEEAIASLRAALELWRGPALSGMSGYLIEAAALVLDDHRLTAVEQLGEFCLATGRAADVVTDLTGVVGEHPLRENLRYLLIVALYRCGRQADAFAVHHAGRRQLRDELGVDPGPELASLHERMLRNDPELLPPQSAIARAEPDHEPSSSLGVGSALPYDTPDFTGRHKELAALSSIVPAASRRAIIIVTIDGMAGVGKTSLAIHAAHQLCDRFPDGQLFLDLLGFTENQRPMEPLDALDRLLRAVGVPAAAIPVALDDRSALWRARIADKSMVLLLDNAASAAQVRPLLPGRPGSVVIVTSRAKLAGLDGAVPVSLAPPSHDDSLAIVRNVLGDQRVADEAAAVDDLVKVCGHLPLAVRLAAARLQSRPLWSVAHLLARLRDVEHGIDELTVEDRSVEAAFRLTYDGLGPEHRRLFRLLGLLPTFDFTAADAATVSGLPRRRAEVLLEELLDARLLEQRTCGERYRFHDLLRAYANATARREESPEECDRVLRSAYGDLLHAVRHCIALIEPGWVCAPSEHESSGALCIQDAEHALAWLDAELDNIVAAIRSAGCLGMPEYAALLGSDIAGHLDLRSLWTTQVELLHLAVEASRRIGDRAAELRAQAGLFLPLWRQGRTVEASSSAESALQLARAMGDRRFEAVCLGNIGALLRGFGQYQRSLDYHARAIRIHRETGNRRHETSALLSLGLVYGALGEHRAALESAQDALRIMRELGTADREVAPLVDIGVAQAGLGRLDAAESTLRSALQVADEVRMPHGVALAELNLAKVLLHREQVEDALRLAEQARTELTVLDAPGIAADIEATRGRIHAVRGCWGTAASAYEDALRNARQANDKAQVLVALTGLIDIKRAAGDHDAERRLRDEAAELAAQLN